MSEIDWTGDTETAVVEERSAMKTRALEFASLYMVFVDDGRARQLLEHWVKSIEDKDVSPAATLQEYAHHEGRRAFVRGIQRQIEFSTKEGNV